MKSKEIPENLDDKEINELIKKIAKPTFNFFIKKIKQEVLGGYYKNMSVNCFISIVTNSMANIDGNLLRWLSGFYFEKVGKEAPYQDIAKHFYAVLKEHIETKIGKN